MPSLLLAFIFNSLTAFSKSYINDFYYLLFNIVNINNSLLFKLFYRDKIKNLSQYPTLDPLMYLKTNNQNNSPHFKSIFTATNFIRYYIFSCSPQLNTFCSNPIFYRRDFNRSKCKMYRVRSNLKYYLNQKR